LSSGPRPVLSSGTDPRETGRLEGANDATKLADTGLGGSCGARESRGDGSQRGQGPALRLDPGLFPRRRRRTRLRGPGAAGCRLAGLRLRRLPAVDPPVPGRAALPVRRGAPRLLRPPTVRLRSLRLPALVSTSSLPCDSLKRG